MAYSRKAPEITIYLNGQADTNWRPIRAQRSAGGSRLDYAICERDMMTSNQRVQDLALREGTNTEVEIVGMVDGQQFVYAWGKISRQAVSVGSGSENISYVVRVEPFHFGVPVQGIWIYNPQPSQWQQIDSTLVFNPIIDGKTEGNRRQGGQHPNLLTDVFLHPESVRTEEAEDEQESSTALWTLAQAVNYLCRTCNAGEPYFINPRPFELTAMFNDERDILRNIVIPDGTYLPQALDLLVQPYGYQWYIDYQRRGSRWIKFFKRGSQANLRMLKMQAPGQILDTALTNTPSFLVEYDLSELYNQVLGLGGFVEIESTWELKRAWSEEDDSKADSPSDLIRTSEDFEDYRNVWRKWVLNEAGDYNDLRDDIKEAHDFSDLADEYTGEGFAPPRRRRFMPMLTLNADKEPIGKIEGVSVQYWRVTGEGEDDGEWVDVIEECDILDRECGVYFTGKNPPLEIMREGENAKVRVTATIRFDNRIKYLAPQQASSPNAMPITLTVDVSDRFQYRKVDRPDVFFDSEDSLATNDLEKLQYYCLQLRDAWDMASISGPVHLEGIDNIEYAVGQAIGGVNGRNIDFNAKGPNAGQASYPQVVGVTYDFQRQSMLLNLDQFRKDKVIERQSREDTAENRARRIQKRTGEAIGRR